MESLRTELLKLLEESVDDAQLADSIVSSGLLASITARATYGEEEVRRILNYSSAASIRAAISKSKQGKGTFPLPSFEGRRWAKSAVDAYKGNGR